MMKRQIPDLIVLVILHFREPFLQSLFYPHRLESKRPRRALVGDTPAAINYIKPVGPGRVGCFRGIFKVIYQGREFDAEISNADIGHLVPLAKALRSRKKNTLFQVFACLPGIGGMSLFDVDDIESNLVPVAPVDPVEFGNLPPKGGSGVTSKNEYHWLLPPEGREFHCCRLVTRLKAKIRRLVSDFQVSLPGQEPQPPKGYEQKQDRIWHLRDCLGKDRRRLTH